MTNDTRTLPQLAEEALAVQDACNLSGVVLSWGRSIHRLRDLLPNVGTDAISRHPVNVLFASKVASLTDCENGFKFAAAYDDCESMKTGRSFSWDANL
jgi:hypothetical protein